MPSLDRRFGLVPHQFRPGPCSFSFKSLDDCHCADAYLGARHVAQIRYRVEGVRFLADCNCRGAQSAIGCGHIHALLRDLDSRGMRWPAARMFLLPLPKPETWDALWRRTEQRAEGRVEGAVDAQYRFVVDVEKTVERGSLGLEVWHQTRTRMGTWSKPQHRVLREQRGLSEIDQEVRGFFSNLTFNRQFSSLGYYSNSVVNTPLWIPATLQAESLRQVCRTGRCHLRKPGDSPSPLQLPVLRWSETPWEVALHIEDADDQWRLSARLQRGEETHPVNTPVIFLSSGVVLFEEEAALFTPPESFPWLSFFRKQQERLVIPRADTAKLVERLQELPGRLRVDAPEEFQYARLAGQPIGCLQIGALRRGERLLHVELFFQYDDQRVAPSHPRSLQLDHDRRTLTVRNSDAEQRLYDQLEGCPLTIDTSGNYRLPPEDLMNLVDQLAGQGWTIEAEGKRLRRSGNFDIRVTSEVDWFDVKAEFDFDGEVAPLPKILSAMRKGEGYVVLDDGSRGLLPTEWLKKFGSLAQLGESAGDTMRFAGSQALLLDALLAAQDNAPIRRQVQAIPRQIAAIRRSGRTDAAENLSRRAESLSARGPGMDQIPSRLQPRRLPGRRHGAREDRPSARPSWNSGESDDARPPAPLASRPWWWRLAACCSTGSTKPRASRRTSGRSVTSGRIANRCGNSSPTWT